MLGGHLPELMVILVLALVMFGPKRLPEIGGSLGKSITNFKAHVKDLDPTTQPTTVPASLVTREEVAPAETI